MPEQKPQLDENQLAFLRVYAALERELGRGPSLGELLSRTAYADRSGVSHMMRKLAALGVIKLREVIPGGMTDTGKRLIRR